MKFFTVCVKSSAALVFALGHFAASASATSYTFSNIASVSNDYASQLSVDVADGGSGTVLFTFLNFGPVAGRIKGISIQDASSLLSNPVILDTPPSVDFTSGGGANIPSSITFDEDFEFKVSGGASKGIDPSESLGIRFNGTLATILSDIDNGDIRFGLHVGSIPPRDGSQKFLNNGRIAVPEAGQTLGLLGVGLLALGGIRRKLFGA